LMEPIEAAAKAPAALALGGFAVVLVSVETYKSL
jgi:hypothetical protein